MDTLRKAPYKDYRAFIRNLVWNQGEHVTAIGPTRSGKTTLLLELVKKRQNVVLFLTKPRDEVLTRYLKANQFRRIKQWPGDYDDHRLALWPAFSGVHSFAEQRNVFYRAINGNGKRGDGIFQEGCWTIVIDETWYFSNTLRLGRELDMLWTQGASNDLTMVAGTQRPRDISQMALDQATHFCFFQVADRYELQRLSEVTGNVADIVKGTVPQLKPHEFLYINRRTGIYFVSKTERS